LKKVSLKGICPAVGKEEDQEEHR